MDDQKFLLSDLENEYIKYFNMIAKKKFNQLKQPCDDALKKIESLKKIIETDNKEENNKNLENFKTEINNSSETLLKPIYLVAELKFSKIYLNTLNILKKIVVYDLINEAEYIKAINVLKDYFFITQNEDVQIKVLEILQHIISGSSAKFSEENIDNLMSICKIDYNKGHIKSIECKNAIQLLLGIFTKKIFDVTDDINVIKFLKKLMTSIEGSNQKEWSNISLQISLIKSSKLEMICQIIETFHDKFKQEGDMINFIKQDMNVFLRKLFALNQDQLISIKLCRLCLINIIQINDNYDLLEEILKYLDKNNQKIWQKVLGLETLSEIFKKPEILFDIFNSNINLYQQIFQSFTNTTYNTILSKSQKSKEKRINTPNNQNTNNIKKQNEHNQINIIPNKKYIISNTNIFMNENNQSLIISQNIEYIFKLLTESYISLKNSYIYLMEKNGININETPQKKSKNINLTEIQEKIKQMITSNFTDFKGGLINILLYQNDVTTVQSFLMIFQSFIYIYTSFDLPSQKDELLNDLCNLALPNNLKNILEIKEKNILIIRTLFNLSHCTNLLEKNSWKIFIQIVQNLYFILIKNGYYIYNEKQQFNIEIIMKNILANIKKYSMESSIVEVQKVVQEDEANKNINNIVEVKNSKTKEKTNKKKINQTQLRTLTIEEKENIDILSNVVNNLFTDSNDYDNETLINVIEALYEDIEKKILFYNKELKSFYDNENLNNENKRKNSLDDIQPNNKKEENIIPNINNEKNNFGKLTTRNSISRSVINPNMIANISEMKNVKVNVNFQNDMIMMNLSYINFNLIKILEIAIINIKRINLIWDKILSIIKLFASKLNQENYFSDSIFKFTIELLISIIINVFQKFDSKNEGKNDENFNEKKIQTYVLTPILNLLNGFYSNYFLNSEFVIEPMMFLLEKCGTQFDIYGWDCFCKIIDLILFSENEAKKNLEILFKMIEQIFSEYSDKLSVLNIEIILDILEKFSLQLENKNISYSSLSFFWQCADIIEKYQKNKKETTILESECLNKKFKKDEDKIKFYVDIWKKLFQKLLIINKDKRFDIKKSAINLFSQFFVAKIKTINEINNLSNDIFNEIFFNIFKNNVEEYLSAKSTDNINNPEPENNENEKDSNNNEEEIILFSFQNLGKIIKSLFEENKLNKNSNNKALLDIIQRISPLYHEIITKKNLPEISNNILKNLCEFDSGDKIFFQENRKIFWEIIEQIINYTTDKDFAEKYSKSVKGNKVIQNIIETLSTCFYSNDDFEIMKKNELIDNNINSLIDIIPKMFNSLKIMNQSLINLDQYSLIQNEKSIFNLIESIGINCQKFNDSENLINYLLKIVSYIKEDKYSIPLSVQSISSIGNILLNNKNLVNYLQEELIKNCIIYCKQQIEKFYELKKDKEILDEMNKHNIKKKDKFAWEKMIESFNDLILKSTIHKVKDEKLWEELINYYTNLYQDLDKEENELNKENNEINNSIIESNKHIQKNIINLIMNILLPNSGNISPNIQQKILNLFDISDKNNEEENKKLFSLDHMNTDNLFNICNYQSEEDLLKIYDKSEDKESISKYVEIKKDISKKFLPILFNNCEKEINNFIEEEKNGKENKELKERLISILDGLKNLDSFCAELDFIDKKNELFISCIKNKKGHLFILQKYFNKLILTKDENVKKKLFEVYEEIARQIY